MVTGEVPARAAEAEGGVGEGAAGGGGGGEEVPRGGGWMSALLQGRFSSLIMWASSREVKIIAQQKKSSLRQNSSGAFQCRVTRGFSTETFHSLCRRRRRRRRHTGATDPGANGDPSDPALLGRVVTQQRGEHLHPRATGHHRPLAGRLGAQAGAAGEAVGEPITHH